MGTEAEFIADVDKYMQGQSMETKIMELQDQLRTFKLKEQQLLMRKAHLQQRLPDIKTALEAVLGLIGQKESGDALLVDYELTDSIYAKAALQNVDTVNLWLGANVMVEYPLEEAKQLLQHNLDQCQAQLAAIEKDMYTVKDNVTITEVSVARVFNWDVEQRRKLKAAGAAS
jgi:prefoldin subunit 5